MACENAGLANREFTPWNRNDTSGLPIDQSVSGWVEDADALVADISEPNHNVTFEVGLALGAEKQIRLIRAASKDRTLLEEIGLLHNIGHDDYRTQADLVAILQRPFTTHAWPVPKRSPTQPVYVLHASKDDDVLRKTLSGVKKIIKLRFRSFDPKEIDRLTATEAFEQVGQSFGVIAIWHDQDTSEAFRQNQRAAFAIGVSKGMDIPFMLLAPSSMRLPLDLDEIATRWTNIPAILTGSCGSSVTISRTRSKPTWRCGPPAIATSTPSTAGTPSPRVKRRRWMSTSWRPNSSAKLSRARSISSWAGRVAGRRL